MSSLYCHPDFHPASSPSYIHPAEYIYYLYMKEFSIMLAAHLALNMLPAGCLMWLPFTVMPDLKLLSHFSLPEAI